MRYTGVEHYKKKVNKKRIFKDLLVVYIIAVIFVLLFNSLVLQAYKVPSESMYPQIEKKDKILVNKFIYGPRFPLTDKRIFDATNKIRRGDIVVFMSSEYFNRNVFFRTVSSIIYTLSFSLIDISHIANHYDENIYLKRVIGVPGDAIKFSIENGKVIVYINGVPEHTSLDIQYNTVEETIDNTKLLSEFLLKQEIIIPENEYYVLGDNRIDSWDSRVWGTVKKEQIIGKAFFKYWPPSPEALQ